MTVILTPALLALIIGFISLSQEILWVRLFSFANYSLPQAFAFVLTFYLIGIALGARIGKTYCELPINLWIISGVVLVISGVFDLVSPWIYGACVHTNNQLTFAGMLILITALCKAILFPIVHHLGVATHPHHIGRRVSRIYIANIMGATVGPLVTGLILLSFFTTQQCYALIALITFLVGLCCLMPIIRPKKWMMMASVFVIIIFGFIITRESTLLIAQVAAPGKIRHIIETRQGIVTLYQDKKGSDLVYGGNVYDGQTNLNPIINSNYINRVIILSTLQNNPERVLMVGLSIGSWLKLIATFPGVKHIDVVEINPGYLQAIKDYPILQKVLFDPRVKIYIDDGRRWLKMHANTQYDLIVMNTTYSWRAYSTNLLSQEFMSQLKQHMKPHAILGFNITGSPDAFKTANQNFSHAYLYLNFVIAADYDWRIKLKSPQAIHTLSTLQLDGKKLFPIGSDKQINAFLNVPIVTFEQVESHYRLTGKRIEVITDFNVLPEFKYGIALH